jgi:pimeloyl-ACP methyl ester carboxylesterase
VTSGLKRLNIHGQEWACLEAGSGEAILLLHGIGTSHVTWNRVIPRLAQTYRVIAPDLLGHGLSAKPREDYTAEFYAERLSELLSLLDVERATVVGHSYGGRVALQFAHEFPDRCERLVLVSCGGLGREVSPLLRLLSLPGAESLLALTQVMPIRKLVKQVSGITASSREHGNFGRVVGDVSDVYNSLQTKLGRAAFGSILRNSLDVRGQTVSALPGADISAAIPTLIVWGAKDQILPVTHAATGHLAMPGSWLEIFEDSAHAPHRQEPQRFADTLERFMAESER